MRAKCLLLSFSGKAIYHPLSAATLPDFRDMFEVNVLSAHIVTKAFIPLLKKGSTKQVCDHLLAHKDRSKKFPDLADIWFARFFYFQFCTRPRTFYGVSERFAKLRMEINTSFSSRAMPCAPGKRFVDYGQTE